MKRKEQQICQKIYEENVERIQWYLRGGIVGLKNQIFMILCRTLGK